MLKCCSVGQFTWSSWALLLSSFVCTGGVLLALSSTRGCKCIFMEERLEGLTKSMTILDLEMPDISGLSQKHASEDEVSEAVANPQSSSSRDDTPEKEATGTIQNSDGFTVSKLSNIKCTQGSVQPIPNTKKQNGSNLVRVGRQFKCSA